MQSDRVESRVGPGSGRALCYALVGALAVGGCDKGGEAKDAKAEEVTALIWHPGF